MKIELRKVSHTNKGAELMLRAMVDHYSQRPHVELTGRIQTGPRSRRTALGIRTLLYASNRWWFATTPRFFPPKPLRHLFGVVHPSEVDLVLDASGFAYGDQWGPDNALQAAAYFRYVRRHGAKVVLMPQSFGPFTRSDVQAATKTLVAEADIIFPRDATAMQSIEELCGQSQRIIQSPDFTPLVHGIVPPGLVLPERAVAIVPNQKMVEMTGRKGGGYVDFVVSVIEILSGLDMQPFFLMHAVQDRQLIDLINKRVPTRLPVIYEDDALLLKGIIGQCHATMCSRFHALVSSLCQGIPSIATGWSHKYKHLLEEYRCPDSLLEITLSRPELQTRISKLMLPEHHDQTRQTLLERASWHRHQVSDMWARVDALSSGD
jgi:polysaccharide pyruvyl transferase WcaK-like protein